MTTIQPVPASPFLHRQPEFISQLQLKNQKAFASLYDAYSPGLYNIICKILRKENGAEDILQNSFIKMWLNIETYTADKGSLFTWMLSIARNETIDYMRSKQAKLSGLTFILQDDLVADQKTTCIDITRMDYLKSISQISCKERSILDLFKSGFTCAEIGKLLLLPEGTVKSRMRTIYKKMRLIHA